MKSLRKTAIFLIGTIFLLCLCSLKQFNFVDNNFNETNNYDFGLPQLSNSNINITTPENITYTNPMSGYYPGTFGFENEVDGESQPKGFNNTYASNCDGVIVSEVGGHKKVFRAYDNNLAGSAIIRQKFNDVGFENQTFGTIEYWFRVTASNINTEFRLNYGHENSDVAVNLRYSATRRWQFYNGTWTELPNIPRPFADTWFHIRIHFRCLGAPSYLGLGENQFEISINGISSGSLDFPDSASEIAMFIPINTAAGSYYGNFAYLDALAYSWDPNYHVGYNRDEGLLLSYDTNINFIWEAYSLDGQANRSIFGNSTIPIPENGLHTIKVSGSDLSGTQYQSDTRYFSINFPIEIHTPEDKTYNEPMSGYYPGTFGFENDAIGESQPKGFNNTYALDCNGSVIAEVDGHKNVFNASDDNTSGSAIIMQRFNDAGFDNQTHGTVEFWFRVDIGLNFKNTEIRLNWGHTPNTGAAVIRIYGLLQQWQFSNGTAWNQIPNLPDPINNTWYHIRINFRCLSAVSYLGLQEDQFEVIINGVSSGLLDFQISTTEIAMFIPILTQGGGYKDNYAYCDAIGYSWDPGYEIGDNEDEGIMVSYDTTATLESIWYSLDGQANITIFGNTTISPPANGKHIIRVFGKDSIGTFYQSPVRHFILDIDYDPPEITIHSPIQDDFYRNTPPMYNITIIELNLNDTWYTLNNGIPKFINTLSGTINQTLWDAFTSEPVTIKFYANDTRGNEGSDEVIVQKDVTAPSSIISFTPYKGTNSVNDSTTFTIDADDGTGSGVVTIRYKINNSAWFTYSTPFDLSSYPIGDYLISYQAIDDVGNVEIENTLLVHLIEVPAEQDGEPIIPGYNIYLLVSLFCLISVFLIKNRKKKK